MLIQLLAAKPSKPIIIIIIIIVTAIFQVDPGLLIPECLHSGFYWSCG